MNDLTCVTMRVWVKGGPEEATAILGRLEQEEDVAKVDYLEPSLDAPRGMGVGSDG